MKTVETHIDRIKVRVLPDGRMPPKDAANYLGRTTGTLKQWRTHGRGPAWLKIAGRVFYQKAVLDEFLATATGPAAVRYDPTQAPKAA
jgi:Helix-turn-helix domain